MLCCLNLRAPLPHSFLRMDTGTGSTRGFGGRVFAGTGTGTGWLFSTRAVSAYPTRKPAGFAGSNFWWFGGLNRSGVVVYLKRNTQIPVNFCYLQHITTSIEMFPKVNVDPCWRVHFHAETKTTHARVWKPAGTPSPAGKPVRVLDPTRTGYGNDGSGYGLAPWYPQVDPCPTLSFPYPSRSSRAH
ncbi:hypothetical protein DFH08DRAFT_442678 [Mycena albidolilacea]|uniref:Uncharacterized protein n=1 Tax=Mycena albidolilacea TaxID=1033008 RepID=A0AAD7EZK0_9AGAR|nr:hypothetical protein DFH08DRAFT_442678 [Mycena albidolilacea]